jgi:carbonic anhydrase
MQAGAESGCLPGISRIIRSGNQGEASMKPESPDHTCQPPANDRRIVLRALAGLTLAGLYAESVLGAALTAQQREQLSPDAVLAMLEAGNERFRSGRMKAHDYLAQKRATISGQYPAAAILSCIDSRAPAEIILDSAIGDAFNARVAGNIADDDLLGSLEFACAAAGAKLILVMGHTSCGAIKGAIDNVELGHLTQLLQKIKPAVAATSYSGERSSKNPAFVDAVAATNVRRTMEQIRAESSVLAGLEQAGKLKIVGSMYHLKGGRVEILS